MDINKQSEKFKCRKKLNIKSQQSGHDYSSDLKYPDKTKKKLEI